MRISDWSSDVCSSDLTVDRYPDESGRQRAEEADDDHRGRGRVGRVSIRVGIPARIFRVDGDDARAMAPSGARGCHSSLDQACLYAVVGSFRLIHAKAQDRRSEEHTSELQSLMRNSYAVFCLKKKKTKEK